jgi:Phage terminase large subunit (GpA)
MNTLSAWWRQCFQPRDRRPIPDWAFDHVRLGPPLTISGQFDVSRSRQAIDIFADLQSDYVREVNVLGPVRGIKTLILDTFEQWAIVEAPGPMLLILQDDKAAKDHAELRTWPNFRRNPLVSGRLSSDRHKNRTTDIIFPHMPFHIRGPADTNLNSKGYRYVLLDEVWMYADGKVDEARARTGDYVRMGTDKICAVSQGGLTGSGWHRQCERGRAYEWQVSCFGCGKLNPIKWSAKRKDGTRWGICFDEHREKSGLWNVGKAADTVRFECFHCGHVHIWGSTLKRKWNETGEYVSDPADTRSDKVRTRHWPAMIDMPWQWLAVQYLEAMNAKKYGNIDPLIKFIQKYLAEFTSEFSILGEEYLARRQSYEIPKTADNGCIRIMSVDCQEEGVHWVMIRDWYHATPAMKAHSKRVWFGKLIGAAEVEAKRAEWGVYPAFTLVDSGDNTKGERGVYKACHTYGWIPVKGTAGDRSKPRTFIHGEGGVKVARSYSVPVVKDIESGLGKSQFIQLVIFCATTYANRVQGLIDQGLWIDSEELGEEMENEYRKQMTAETRQIKYKGTGIYRVAEEKWVCPSKNNHAFDCAKINALGATIQKYLPDIEAG